jgi:hypothetical protein
MSVGVHEQMQIAVRLMALTIQRPLEQLVQRLSHDFLLCLTIFLVAASAISSSMRCTIIVVACTCIAHIDHFLLSVSTSSFHMRVRAPTH